MLVLVSIYPATLINNFSCKPPPHSTSSCPNQCHSTYCNACYYSKDPCSPPKQCNKKVCKDKWMTPECLRHWAKCVDKKDRKRNNVLAISYYLVFE